MVFFAWYHGCLSLFFYHWNWSLSFTSLSGMFLFFKWFLASSLAAVSIWWNEHIKGCAALTKQCELAGWLAPAFCCKAPAEVTGWQQRATLHKRVVSAVVESGQDNRAERWPGLLATCQLVSATHRTKRAQRSTKGRRYGGQEWGRRRKGEESGWHLHVLEFFYQWWAS